MFGMFKAKQKLKYQYGDTNMAKPIWRIQLVLCHYYKYFVNVNS